MFLWSLGGFSHSEENERERDMRLLKEMRAKGVPFSVIAERIGRPAGSLMVAASRLGVTKPRITYPLHVRARAVKMVEEGQGLRTVGRKLRVSHRTVGRWYRSMRH
jgi:DNA invertase Pin-like site-specific DNA recombinase